MPPGVRLVEWRLKEPPVCLEIYSIVMDSAKFAASTLGQIQALLNNPRAKVGWTMPQLIDRLTQVGVRVALETNEAVERVKQESGVLATATKFGAVQELGAAPDFAARHYSPARRSPSLRRRIRMWREARCSSTNYSEAAA